MKFIIASNNPKKISEIAHILKENGVDFVLPLDLDLELEVEETGKTFAENALLKAQAFAKASGLPAIGDDSGLCINGLSGFPGIYSARFGRKGMSDTQRRQDIQKLMEPLKDRSASLVSCVCCIYPDGRQFGPIQKECPGTILPKGERGTFGLLYDPIFVPDSSPDGKTFGEMTNEERAPLSYRRAALNLLCEVLPNE